MRNDLHGVVKEFRPGWKSSEFLRVVLVGVVVAIAQAWTDDLIRWAYTLSILCASFSIGRGIFKKSRLTYVGTGERTTEFWVTFVGMIMIACRWYFFRDLPMSDSILAISICEAGYQLGRGIGKSFIPRENRVLGLG